MSTVNANYHNSPVFDEVADFLLLRLANQDLTVVVPLVYQEPNHIQVHQVSEIQIQDGRTLLAGLFIYSFIYFANEEENALHSPETGKGQRLAFIYILFSYKYSYALSLLRALQSFVSCYSNHVCIVWVNAIA